MNRLCEPDAKRLLAAAGLRAPRGAVAGSAAEAEAVARSLGCPVVVKAVSADLTHKSAAGGVRFAGGPHEVRAAYSEVLAAVGRSRPEAHLEGVLVEERLTGGIECVLGLLDAPGFGPVVMFGLGGLFVEVLGDVAFRFVPLAPRDVRAMIGELHGRRLLAPHVNALVAAVVAFAGLSDRVREAEVNPLLARDDGLWALDAVATLR